MPNRFQDRISNWAGTRVSVGPTVTSGAANTYGTYTNLLTATAYETFLMEIIISSAFTAGNARNGAVTIGVDQAGGTSYVDTIQHLLCGAATTQQTSIGLGYAYTFPLYVPAGASVAAKYTSTLATQTAVVGLTCWGKPSSPEQVRCGTYVDSIGFNAATTLGVTVTPSLNNTIPTYVSLGALPRAAWWYQAGYMWNDATMTANLQTRVDAGVGSSAANAALVYDDCIYSVLTANEQVSMLRPGTPYPLPSPAGQNIYCRAWCASATADSGGCAVGYALGG